ncbi:MAG: hypothetical protein HOH38_03330 [Nitrospinaceae bacterium]|jgi:hypothetical protein|nr:hypothetical protein [Nitrospinaceae bacterium]
MKNDSTITIPLVVFSSSREGREPSLAKGEYVHNGSNYIRITPARELPKVCYGVRVESLCKSPLLPRGSLAVFSKSEGPALGNIYAVEVQNEIPFLGKWVQKESADDSDRRKVFMVPTPLHVPSGKVSPIAPSLHHVLLFKDLENSGGLRLIPANKLVCKHPLVYVE